MMTTTTTLTFFLLSLHSIVQVQAQHPDIVVTVNVPGGVNPGPGWGDSYSVGDECFCETTYDHGIRDFQVETPVGWMTVEQACNLIGPGPGSAGRPKYNDVQCGNGPPNDAGDEHTCPGRVDIGSSGCGQIGPKWKFTPSPSPPTPPPAPTPPAPSTPSPTKSPVMAPPTLTSVFIPCGPGNDEQYISGTYWTDTTGQSIANTGTYSQSDFSTARSGSGFTYTVGGFSPGVTATITLGWAELWSGACAAGKRQFNVEVNGVAMVTNYDVGATAGGCYSAVFETQTFTANGAGEFVLVFSKGNIQNPLINIIDIQV